tara:strand:- start:16613 stop:16759 length:147 start_codon:yes stop_codon:yes gene_type:complete
LSESLDVIFHPAGADAIFYFSMAMGMIGLRTAIFHFDDEIGRYSASSE